MSTNIHDISFESYGLSKEIMRSLELLNYKFPTEIQQETIPAMLKGRDIVGKSKTGTGKTAAFGIPLCEKIRWEEKEPQALVLEPTRELAVQVQEELFQIGRMKRIKVPVVFGGMPVDKQAVSLKQKAHILVGTPGRVLDHLRRGNIHFDNIRFLVIDEADLMLDMGFLEDVELIMKSILHKPQILLFSATMGEHLYQLVDQYMIDRKVIQINAKTETADGLNQVYYKAENDEKFDLLIKILTSENPKNAMIFCDTREMVNTLYQKMKRKRIRCGMLHGGMEQRDRLYAISDYKAGKFHYLVTTDVAARGIDFPGITHVINYDFPTKRENYVHRIGRTARNGKTGKAFSLISEMELHYKDAVESYAGILIEEGPKLEEENKSAFEKRQKEKIVIQDGKEAAFKKEILKLTISGGKKSKMRPLDVVGTICSIDGIKKEDIGIIDVRDSITYVEILNGQGERVYQALQTKTIKGKIRKIKKTR